MRRKLYQEIASRLQARLNCQIAHNDTWEKNHRDTIELLVKNFMPSGSGIDCGTKIDLDASTPDKLVFIFSYHHMDDNGMYSGWTEHRAIVTPSLAHGMEVKITGPNRRQIKDYLHETYDYSLHQEIEGVKMGDDVEWTLAK